MKLKVQIFIEKEVDDVNGCLVYVVKKTERKNKIEYTTDLKRFSEAYYEKAEELKNMKPQGGSALKAAEEHKEKLEELYIEAGKMPKMVKPIVPLDAEAVEDMIIHHIKNLRVELNTEKDFVVVRFAEGDSYGEAVAIDYKKTPTGWKTTR